MQIFIYSRKSKWTGRGDSIENQVQMCREYIEGHIKDADKAEICVFEDEGYSGKNTKRPEFQKMMQEIKKGGCKYLVCYKLDRMGRNIIDIASLVEELNELKVSFISIKENFDTSTPLGKTMLYIAGIFAQMEREQIAERVKDNMVMLARSGRWLGGNTPLGFYSEKNEKIQINDKVRTSYVLTENQEEMATVHFIFQEFLEKQSLGKVAGYFLENDILTKRGREYTTTAVRDILTNPVYCIADGEAYDYFEGMGCQVCFSREEADGTRGLMAYARTSSSTYKNKNNPPEEWIIALGKHRGEIAGKDYVKVQKLIGMNRQKGEAYHKVKNEVALLSGILYCTCGHAMRPKYYSAAQKTKEGERKFSYLCPYKERTHGKKCMVENVPGNALDELVCDKLFQYVQPDSKVKKMLEKLKDEIENTKEISGNGTDLLKQSISEKEKSMECLVTALGEPGRSPAFIAYVDGEIARLSGECDQLKKKMEAFQKNEAAAGFDAVQIDWMAEQMSSFAKTFQMLTVPRKRESLRALIEKVVWNGDTADIFLYGSQEAE